MRRDRMLVFAVIMAGQLLLPVVFADDRDGQVMVQTSGRVPGPAITAGRGDQCVEDTDFMRRNHMHMLKHQRDETVLRGVRVKQYSLKQCIDCHAVTGQDARPVSIDDPKHFCRACHDYAAVKVDCFQCHASRPGSTDSVAQAGEFRMRRTGR